MSLGHLTFNVGNLSGKIIIERLKLASFFWIESRPVFLEILTAGVFELIWITRNGFHSLDFSHDIHTLYNSPKSGEALSIRIAFSTEV